MVLDDADVDEAVAAATFGAFMHQGQICMSTERLVVQEKIVEPFVEKLVTRAKSLRVGNPTAASTSTGADGERALREPRAPA